MRPLKGFWTVVFAIAVTVAGALQALDWAALIPNNPTVVGYIVMGLGIIVGALRYITTTPMGKSS